MKYPYDVHSHGAQTGITSKAPPSDDLANAMLAGSLGVTCLADLPDDPVLGRNAGGTLAAVRTPHGHHLESPGRMDNLVANHASVARPTPPISKRA
jgi:membrane dipeptidase